MFMASIREGSSLDTIWKADKKKEEKLGKNLFRLFKNIFVCNKVVDLKTLLKYEDEVIVAAYSGRSFLPYKSYQDHNFDRIN